MSNKREKFNKHLATIESYVFSVNDLITAMVGDYFAWTLDGAIKTKKPICGGGEQESAFWWMKDNYNSIAAEARAAMYLSKVAHELMKQLLIEASELILDKQEGGADNGETQS